MKRLSKHDRYVKELCEQIAGQYDQITIGHKIQKSKRCYGEIDVMAKRGDDIDVYEVKCSHRPLKAHKQLTRIRRFIGASGRSFFYCGQSRLLMAMQV